MIAIQLPFEVLDNGSVLILESNDSIVWSLNEFKSMTVNELYLRQGSLNIVLIVLYVIVFFLAAISNALVIIVIYRFQHLHSVTNWFLVNLSVADLLVTAICMPLAMSLQVTEIWFYGLFMCKFTSYLQGVAASSSVFSILAMSLDRYFAIRHPIIFRQFFNKRVARCVIGAIWLVACLLFIPTLLVTHEDPVKLLGLDRTGNLTGQELPLCVICIETWMEETNRRAYTICLFLAVYALPVALVLTAYIRMGCKLCTPSTINKDGGDIMLQRDSRLLDCRRRVARTLLVLAFVFALCWMPYHIILLVFEHLDPVQYSQTLQVLPFTLWLGHANSAANPLLYCLLSRNIRQSLWNLFRPDGHASGRTNSSEPLPMVTRRRGRSTRTNKRYTTASHTSQQQRRQPHHLQQADGADADLRVIYRDSIVDADHQRPPSRIRSPSKGLLIRSAAGGYNSSFTTALLPVHSTCTTTITTVSSMAKLVHVNSHQGSASTEDVHNKVLERTPSCCHSL